MDFTKSELVEISDVISAALDKYLVDGDPEKHERSYGTLTLLHEAQAKILPAIFRFSINDVPWGPERAEKIASLRVGQGLPAQPTDEERCYWNSTVARDNQVKTA